MAGLALPFGLGVALTGSVVGGLTGLLWGGAVRIFLLHHATFSINSLCHFFGRRRFGTGDESRNLAWLAPITFGEAWHNNHHAFPTSARHGLGRGQVDPGAWLIAAPSSAATWRGTSSGSRRSASRRSASPRLAVKPPSALAPAGSAGQRTSRSSSSSLGDHDRRRVRVAAHQRGHDRGVHDAQPRSL